MTFFVLGNHPELSVAEILAVLGPIDYKLVDNSIMLVEQPLEFEAQALIRRLGGTIKIGQISQVMNNWSMEQALTICSKILVDYQGKVKFGFSVYGQKQLNAKPLAMELKKHLKTKNLSSRWVTSKESTLSSVVVEQNKLIEQGSEIVVIKDGYKYLLGKTLAVQVFKELSARDYGRPARDDYSGMLPPKLAQIMINLSEAKLDQVLLDPFCGSGTVLSESLLMGFEKVIGTDISAKAIKDTQANLAWLKKKHNVKGDAETKIADVADLTKVLSTKSVEVVVTEPYLGPQRGQIDAKKIIKELTSLYEKALSELHQILKDGGRVVMVWPVIKNQNLPIQLKGFVVKKSLANMKNRSLIYSRAGQKIKREIIVLEKK